MNVEPEDDQLPDEELDVAGGVADRPQDGLVTGGPAIVPGGDDGAIAGGS
jgi:hypothetical protein